MLFHMLKAQPKPADVLAPSVPKMTTLTVPQSAIGKIIGPGLAIRPCGSEMPVPAWSDTCHVAWVLRIEPAVGAFAPGTA